MKKILVPISLVFTFSLQAFAQNDDSAIKAAVSGFFNGLSLANADSIRCYSTDDFLLLEEGLVWNVDTLICKVIPPKYKNLQRINSFNFIRIESDAEKAWAGYWNTAEFILGEKRQTVKWLESVVLIKSKGCWKIQLMHSTKLKSEAVQKP